jgi:hypothetical protein
MKNVRAQRSHENGMSKATKVMRFATSCRALKIMIA